MNHFCPIKDNFKIYCELENRWLQLGLRHSDIVADATYLNYTIDYTALTRYCKSFDEDGELIQPAVGRLSAENILWLCARWGVDVDIIVSPAKGRGDERAMVARAKKFNPKNIF